MENWGTKFGSAFLAPMFPYFSQLCLYLLAGIKAHNIAKHSSVNPKPYMFV